MPEAFGTLAHDAPITRTDLERALRQLNLADLGLRDDLMKLAAHVVALTDELTRRIDGVEPEPAPPGTQAPAPRGTVEASVQAQIPGVLANVLTAHAAQPSRVALDLGGDKYAVEAVAIPCEELIPLCGARCCQMAFPLSTQDLDEGVIRWDYGQPYLIRQRASDGFCVHNDPASHGCTVHAYRPRACRRFDCRNDARVWIDYDKRIPAPAPTGSFGDATKPSAFDLVERVKKRAVALAAEKSSLALTAADAEPCPGPAPVAAPSRRVH